MPLLDTALVTVEQARGRALGDANNADRDEELTRLINAVTIDLERQTARIFKARDLTESFTGTGLPFYFTQHRPIISIASIEIDGVVLAADGYVVEAALGRISLIERIFTRAQPVNCAVGYRAGYETLDDDLVELALDILHHRWESNKQAGPIATSVSIGAQTLSIRDGLPKHVKDAIERLKARW